METIFVLVSKEAWNEKQQEVIDLRKENERLTNLLTIDNEPRLSEALEKRVNQQGFDVRNLKESMDDHNKRLCNLEFGIEPVMRVLEAVKKVADEMAD